MYNYLIEYAPFKAISETDDRQQVVLDWPTFQLVVTEDFDDAANTVVYDVAVLKEDEKVSEHGIVIEEDNLHHDNAELIVTNLLIENLCKLAGRTPTPLQEKVYVF